MVHYFDNIIGNKNHECEKPVDLMNYYVCNSAKKNDIILDPFAGVAPVVLASIKNNMRYIASEIDKKYFDIGLKRIDVFKNEYGII